MPIEIVRNDITKMAVDAIVNAANSSLLGGGGVDGCIHRAAGDELLEECRTLGGCNTGCSKLTHGYKLPCKYIIHTVGPVWRGGDFGEKELLASCYKSALGLAKENELETVAFPLISAGIYGYPKDKALQVAIDTIGEFLAENEMTVYLVIFDKKALDIGHKLFSSIKEYIDDRYAEEFDDLRVRSIEHECDTAEHEPRTLSDADKPVASINSIFNIMPASASATRVENALDSRLKQLDESFSQMLLRLIDEKKMTDAQCYKKANIDRKHFSKIRSDIHYKPSKQTAVAFAIALELDLEQTRDMLMKAGYALSHSSKADIIIEYFIENGNYDINLINEALFAFDQALLGV